MKQLIIFSMIVLSSSLFGDFARQQYLNKDYETAKSSYQILQSKSPNNFSYNYNLGSTYFRLENYIQAKYYFLKALKLKPNHSDTKYNLTLVNKTFIDKQFIFNNYWKHLFILNIKSVFSILMLISLGILILLLLGVLNNRSHRTRRFALIIVLTLLIFNTIAIIFWVSEPNYAVIEPERVQVYSGPSETQKPLFFAHKGAECKIIESSSVWTNIQFPNGLKGWVKELNIMRI